MTREIFISRYSPNRTNPEDLEAITVQREELLSSAVESIRTSVLTESKHHLLFVGPRGSGKTHSITLIHHRICKMEDLKPNLRIAWLNEDETSDTLLALLLRIHRTLSFGYPEEFPPESLETILDLTDRDAATDAATDLLLQQLGNRTLFIMLKNLDALFRDMTGIEQKRWRALIQNHPQFCTLATAQRLFNGVSSQDEPFFGFFQITHLHPFKVDDATDLLIKLARLKDDPDLADCINSPRGRARIRALHHLTGGNQRLFIILSDFIDRDSLEELVGPFEELVDEQLTPYYQERLRWLPTLQRKIVEFLCSAHKPMPVKEIARQLFATHPTIAGQLRDLRKMGYVTSNQRGRESLYELSEPLMRLSSQVKDAKGRTPLRLFVS
ncbi:MAG: ArsR family transcriptional regulator [Pontiella sp.]